MADERYTFSQARTRLEEIVSQVRKKDVSLETSLDLLEEGVRLANVCTELSDHTEWRSVAEDQAVEIAGEGAESPDADGADGDVAEDASIADADAASGEPATGSADDGQLPTEDSPADG